MDYAQSLQYLYSFVDWERGIGYGTHAPPRFTLERIAALLRGLGDPHRRFPSVHVAGSKGKGSTAALIESILRAAGLRTGLYTQPHLHTFRERVRIDNTPVSEETFTRLVERVATAAAALEREQPALGKPTTYELATALGFLCFAEAEVDVAVVEVGLGGRLDATNVLTPQVAVITSISLEHTAILGNTLAAIAREKAGIVKDGGVLVHAPGPAAVTEVFQTVCAARRARIIEVDASRCVAVSAPALPPWEYPAQMCKITALGTERTVRLPLRGPHQRLNCGVALAVVEELAAQGVPLSIEAVCAGIEAARWPGRFEQLSAWPPVVADGAHTPDAMRRLRETLAAHYPGRGVHCILGLNRDKDAVSVLEALLPAVKGLIAVKSRHPRAQDPRGIAAAAGGLEIAAERAPVRVAQDVRQAIALGLNEMEPTDVLCATGSLFVAAEAREAFGLAGAVDPPLDPSHESAASGGKGTDA